MNPFVVGLEMAELGSDLYPTSLGKPWFILTPARKTAPAR
jgi:hypothetical protein